MSKWGCGNAARADSVRARKYHQKEKQQAKAEAQAKLKAALEKRKGEQVR